MLIITDWVFTHAFQDELLLFLIVAALLQATAQIRPGIGCGNSDYDCRWNSFALVTLHLFYFLSNCCVFPHAGASERRGRLCQYSATLQKCCLMFPAHIRAKC